MVLRPVAAMTSIFRPFLPSLCIIYGLKKKKFRVRRSSGELHQSKHRHKPTIEGIMEQSRCKKDVQGKSTTATITTYPAPPPTGAASQASSTSLQHHTPPQPLPLSLTGLTCTDVSDLNMQGEHHTGVLTGTLAAILIGGSVKFQDQRVVIQNSHSEKLVGILHETGLTEVVIVCHGFRSCKDRIPMVNLVVAFAIEGIGAFRFDFAGNGVLSIHGSADKIVPMDDAMEFAKRILNHKLHIINGADHEYTCHQNELASIALDFVKNSSSHYRAPAAKKSLYSSL
ncbi:hypothetical protein M8C21_019853 [Ambrosia artemisiifolia]|uniref:Uncharacterized protein n=1 Tax=Ambrosia artemisiifolia TaxID=4212 RepID=A0AAD5CJ97_AMBAR|nr:hypothetical protein M8C21_019853 [Ambrosia artemisiifolia]